MNTFVNIMEKKHLLRKSKCFIFHNIFKCVKRCYFRNRSALIVNCWVIIHCLGVSCKEDQVTCASREWFTFIQLSDKQWIIIQQFTLCSWSISILTQNKRLKHIWSVQLLLAFRYCTEELPPILRLRRICLHVFVTSFKRKTALHRLTPWMTSFSGSKWCQLARTFLALSKLWIIVWYITLFNIESVCEVC